MEVDNSYYICHYCVEYKTIKQSDILRHFRRKSRCKCNTLFSFENAFILSSKKKYYFNLNMELLNRDDMIYIITHNNEKINYIDKDFRSKIFEKEDIKKEYIKNEDKKDIKNYKEYLDIFNNNQYISNNHFANNIIDILDKQLKSISFDNNFDIFNNYIKKEENKSEDTTSNELVEDKEDKSHLVPLNIKGYYYDGIYNNVFHNTKNNTYYCANCDKDYANINSVRKHLIKGVCKKRQHVAQVFDESNKQMSSIIEKEINKKSNNKFVQNIQNIQNIQNNNNNNNDTKNNTYNLNLRDFVHEKYDLSHITDEFYQQKDFFLYDNLLKIIMENKKNRNIFFTNTNGVGEAIIYTNNELNRMSSDKAGYLILDKLSQSFDQLYYKQDEETRQFYSFITKYYYVVKGQYKHDTIHKIYDVENKCFIYTANSNFFRSRDKYLSRIITIMNPIQNSIRENMCSSISEINDIPFVNPNIEDFVSTRMRYRDLKN